MPWEIPSIVLLRLLLLLPDLSSVCINDIASTYSVDNHGGSTYNWTVTGGSIVSGQGTSIIQVNWGPTGMIGLVEVMETNACSEGERQELIVDIGPVPTSAVMGPISAGAGSTGTIYYVTGRTRIYLYLVGKFAWNSGFSQWK